MGSGEASVRNTRSHGTSTSSSHIWPSSSSKRALSGAANGLASRATGRRQTTVTPGALTATVDAAVRTDIDVLGEGRAGVHADLAADHQALVGLPDDAERRALHGIL